MDHDADGILDFLSGSYDPGDVYLFRGLGSGQYAAGVSLRDKADLPLVHHPEQLARYLRTRTADGEDSDEESRNRVASFGSWVAPVDWDGDGDLDLLLGSFEGDLFVRVNEGTREAPAYAPAPMPVPLGSQALHVNGHANPVVADWDGDGLWDLVISASDGSVGYYRNIGRRDSPLFAERRDLVPPKATSIFLTQYLAPGALPQPGVRAQICVADQDGDGRLDLLLGDHSAIRRLRALSTEEQATFDGLAARLDAIDKQLAEADEEDDTSGLDKEHAQVRESMQAYCDPEAERRLSPTESRLTSSFVWLFRRAPAPSEPAATDR